MNEAEYQDIKAAQRELTTLFLRFEVQIADWLDNNADTVPAWVRRDLLLRKEKMTDALDRWEQEVFEQA
jgi:hypothetical protein